jgi:hypothetical protein
MSFLYPAFLLGAIAVAVPVILHLLRRDVAPEVPFTAVRLLRRSPIQRSRRRRLQDLLLLGARIAALLLLAAAFARPYAPAAASVGTRVVAIDRSYSMSAPGRFERALELARGAIDQAGTADRVAVIAFDERADLVARAGARSDARAALEALAPSFGATRYAPAVRRAIEEADGARGTLVIVSDLQRGGWNDGQPFTLPAGWDVEVMDAGEPEGNLSIAGLSVEPARLIATVNNGWKVPKTGRMRVLYDEREIAAAQYSVGPAGSTDVIIPLRVPASGGLAVSLPDPGGLAADDVRYRALGPGAQRRVLIVTYGGSAGFYLARALETSASDEGGFAVDRSTGPSLSTLAPERLSETSLIVLTATRGLDRRARETVASFTRAGGGLLITVAPDLEDAVLSTIFGWQPTIAAVDTPATPLTFAATDLRHPVFSPFGPLLANLGQVRFERMARVRPDGWDVAARFSDGTPALLERAEGKGKVMLFASDFDRRWNDFPLHPAFVPFTLETVRYAAGKGQRAREFTVAEPPPGVTARPGIYQLDAGKRTVSVNVDAAEGDLTRLSSAEFQKMFVSGGATTTPAVSLQAVQVEAGQAYWRYGLVLMLAVLVAESFVGRVRE